MKWTNFFLILLIIALILTAGCISTEKTTVKVLAAGSLLAPLEDIEAAKAHKLMIDGTIYIEKGGQLYTLTGLKVN